MRVLALLVLLAGCPAEDAPETHTAPPVLWAWARPMDLTAIDASRWTIAVWARTVHLDGDGVRLERRTQPIALPPGARTIAVVRLEAHAPTRSAAQRAHAVDAIAEALRPEAVAVQLDFDAAVADRGFYVMLVRELRARIGRARRLQVTALASWCLGDPWITALDVDEAIPMLFRMGPDAAAVRRHLDAGGDFSLPLCRRSVGLATDEPSPRLPSGRRRFWFSPRAWSAAALPPESPT